MAEELVIPDEFTKVMRDFISDIRTTFPEYTDLIKKWYKTPEDFSDVIDDEERKRLFENAEQTNMIFLFKFCQKKYPPRFFEILYQSDSLFKEDSELDTEFLPNILFKNLWNCDISDKTRGTIWKYLQLILFSVIGSMNNKDAFGDTAKLFEAINDEDFKAKLEETLAGMEDLFSSSNNEDLSNNLPNFNMEDMPNVNDLHNHITGMLDGKLGQLAKEIAEETANELNMDMDNVTDMKDVFNKLIKNPTKLMGLVKNIGSKLDERIKSGEIKESEIMAEASEMMQKMKNMPGMGNIQSMMSKMGMAMPGGKMNMGAMESQLNRNMKAAQMRERMKAKVGSKPQTQPASVTPNMPTLTEEQIMSVFSTGEHVEKTPRKPKATTGNPKKKKSKK